MELLAEVDRDTLYFDGFDDIKSEINKIKKKNNNFKIVVFVDDLDRCSPKKTLEVLESIKVFLGIEGFIYIIGLSHDIVTKLIDIEFKESGVKGEQYIKKIIQIPITLPKWDNQDIINLVKDFVEKEIIDNKYKKTIDENIELISTAIENNPREIKRFINNFIVSSEIFSSGKHIVVAKELLVIQAIQLRWNKFYDLLIKSDENFLKELNRYLQMDEEILLKNLESDEQKKDEESYDLKVKRMLRDFKSDTDLWSFLKKNSSTLNNIKDWNIYRRATEVSKEPIQGDIFIHSTTKLDLDKAKAFEDIGQHDRALRLYDKVLEKEPENFLAIYNRAIILERIERYEEALKAIDYAIDIYPANNDVWYHKAYILEKLGRYEEALEAIDIDLRLDSNKVKSWTNKAKLLEQMKRYKEAIECYDKALRINPNDIITQNNKKLVVEHLSK